MEPRSRAGTTVNLFRLPKTDTCQILSKRNVCTAPLLIIFWEEIMLVSKHFKVFRLRN